LGKYDVDQVGQSRSKFNYDPLQPFGMVMLSKLQQLEFLLFDTSSYSLDMFAVYGECYLLTMKLFFFVFLFLNLCYWNTMLPNMIQHLNATLSNTKDCSIIATLV
jgi:hypothetical protein